MRDLGDAATVDEMSAPRSDPAVGVTVTVRYWAAARAAAGRAEDTIERVSTVKAALDAAVALRPDNPRFAQVLSVSSLLLGDRPVQRGSLDAVALSAGDVLEVLPPFAGG